MIIINCTFRDCSHVMTFIDCNYAMTFIDCIFRDCYHAIGISTEAAES